MAPESIYHLEANFNEVILVINLSGETLPLNTVGVPLIERSVGSGMTLYLPKGLLATLCLGALSSKKITTQI